MDLAEEMTPSRASQGILGMMSRTYLYNCLKDEHLCRWPDSAMPIHVYIAPFTWYEKKKQQQSLTYRQLILDSLSEWQKATSNLIRFQVVEQLNNSQIDFKWRRVDRKALGHCTYEVDKQYRIFSAEIQIGISDGLLHASYQDTGEVKHTVIHEIGHALGLIGHSDAPGDIMYVPHQYGIHQLSKRDIESISWLYQLPVGFSYRAVSAKYNLKPGYTINDVIDKIERRIKGEEIETPPPIKDFQCSIAGVQSQMEVSMNYGLDEHHEILSEMGRFYLKTQNIRINKQQQDELRRIMLEKKLQNKHHPPYPNL